MVVARASKSAISILMASSVVVTVECLGLIMGNIHTRLNVLTVVMYMEQTDLTCMRESALSAKMAHPGSGIGRLPSADIIWQIGRGNETKRYS